MHFWIVYLCENPNVKQLLDDGRYVEKAFPSDLYPALNSAEALYVDEESRNFRGYSPSGKLAELNWTEVLGKNLSDDLVEYLENEGADTSCEESEASHKESFDEEESRRSEEDVDEGEDSGSESGSESPEGSPEQEPDATRAPSSPPKHALHEPGARYRSEGHILKPLGRLQEAKSVTVKARQ